MMIDSTPPFGEQDDGRGAARPRFTAADALFAAVVLILLGIMLALLWDGVLLAIDLHACLHGAA
ncbi:hypothetical protein [Methylovirgula sp. HY1]|uniref:hypothetical protein n=1 Tax=Methylovirgula sp. HY1 TaxID=2822761 RepID=UPI001C5B388A|nr:hypothetical protein [Methylovirgula sp. HY1]